MLNLQWYEPITGRWLSNDPIGISGGLNQYVFCADNPVTFTDPFGLCDTKMMTKIATTAKKYSDAKAIKWNRWRSLREYGWGTWKCNIFVADVIRESGAYLPDIYAENKHPPTALQWFDERVKIEGWIVLSGPIPGAIGSDGTHCGIVAPDGTSTISVIHTGPVGNNDWGFRNPQSGMTWRGCVGTNQ